MRKLLATASLMTVLAASTAFGGGLAPPAPHEAAYIEIDSGTMTVIATKATVTQTPDSKGKVVGMLTTGDQVTVYETNDKWAHIHSKSSNLDGYVRKSLLQ